MVVQLGANGPIIKCTHAKYDAFIPAIVLFEPQFKASEFELLGGARLVEIGPAPTFMCLYLPLEISFVYFEEGNG